MYETAGYEEFQSGRWGAVVWARNASGQVPGRDYLNGLPRQAQARLQALAQTLADVGHLGNEESHKRLHGGGTPHIWELKIHRPSAHRFFCYRSGDVWVITHGAPKPENNSRYDPHIERAQRIAAELEG